MICRHVLTIKSRCPVDNAEDTYEAVVTVKNRLLDCEYICRVVDELTQKPIFQERLTQEMADRLMTTVVTAGTHCGGRVRTTCRCKPRGEHPCVCLSREAQPQ